MKDGGNECNAFAEEYEDREHRNDNVVVRRTVSRQSLSIL